jgi:outer membrane biosynthesis protein TonB
MRVTARKLLWLAPLLLMGCGHKTQPAQTQTLAPPIVDMPPAKPAPVSTADLPPPVLGTTPTPTPEPVTPPPAPAKKPVHHPRKPAVTPAPDTTPATTPATPAQQDTAANPAPSVSAIGQLSEGSSGDLRSKTEDSIQQTEKSVNAITRSLSDQETKTVAQIREYLKEANDALKTGDVDGAHNLVEKAKVLLNELNQ